MNHTRQVDFGNRRVALEVQGRQHNLNFSGSLKVSLHVGRLQQEVPSRG